MKIAIGAIVALFVVFAALPVALHLLPSDIVTSTYGSLEEAREDQLFVRGWLPNILPPSARNIRTENNLDLNLSEGEFYYQAAEHQLLAAHLAPYETLTAPFAGFEGKVSSMERNGLSGGRVCGKR